jgi:hypothetical protein
MYPARKEDLKPSGSRRPPPAAGSQGARLGAMANVREPLINVDSNDKPKRLTGLNQKVRSGLSL